MVEQFPDNLADVLGRVLLIGQDANNMGIV